MKLKLLADSDTHMPSHSILSAVPLLSHGEIDAEPKLDSGMRTEVRSAAKADHVSPAIGLPHAADPRVAFLLPNELGTDPPLPPNGVGFVRPVRNIEAGVQAVA